MNKKRVEEIKRWFAEIEQHKDKVDLESFAEQAFQVIPVLLKRIEELEKKDSSPRTRR